jgi:hypothetical protein
MEQLVESFGACACYASLDLFVAYDQRIVHPESQDPTTFQSLFIDDVAIKGPVTRYENTDGTYETILENSGIHYFVWEHLANIN